MPTASGGSRTSRPGQNLVDDDHDDADQRAVADQIPVMSPPSTPFASDEISGACGAASAFGPAPGIPWKPKECSGFEHRSDHQRAEDDADHERDLLLPGVAPTSWPVFRSWRLSFEMVAIENTIAIVNSAYAVSAWRRRDRSVEQRQQHAAPSTARMPTPDTGLFDAPMRPAM